MTGIGVALIVVGVVLFVNGRRRGPGGDTISVWNIKISVSNPALVLVVLGILMMIVPQIPQLMSNKSTENLKSNSSSETSDGTGSSTTTTNTPTPGGNDKFVGHRGPIRSIAISRD